MDRPRRGPTPVAPYVSASDRARFFEHLRREADRSRRGTAASDPAGIQLRRQVYYLAAWDPSGDARRWLEEHERVEQRRRRRFESWTPEWAARRTLVIARARQGDREPLQDFIRSGINHDQLEAANLNYWAYWIEETPDIEHTDDFMATDLGSWGGVKLLQRLHDSLTPQEAVIDLCVHSIWALLQRRPWLLAASPGLAGSLYTRVDQVSDTAELSAQARGELQQIEYGIRINQPSGR